MPDDYLTVDEVAGRLSLPLEMIQRRIESGDIPIHWIEISGKLEMRISATEIGVGSSPPEQTPFPTATEAAPEDEESAQEEVAPPSWGIREPDYSPEVWSAGDSPQPEADPATPDPGWSPAPEVTPAVADWNGDDAADAPPAPSWSADATADAPPAPSWETVPQAEGTDADQPPEAAPAPAGPEPLWRAEPTTWEDEPLEEATPAAADPEAEPVPSSGTDAYFPMDEAELGLEPAPEAGESFATSEGTLPDAAAESELEPATAEALNFDVETVADEDAIEIPEFPGVTTESESFESEFGETEAAAPAGDVPPPSALAMAQGADSSLALNSIDARELVAGLFERWERALEQRIQAEQRLRFETELERRLRQIQDLRQELDQARKSTAQQLAEREQEVMELRARLRDQETATKGRGLFRR